MQRIAKFEKVSKFQFVTDYKPLFEGRGEPVWEGISLPRRATTGSAGYDFYAPFEERNNYYTDSGTFCQLQDTVML